MEEIAKRKDLNRNEHYYLIKDSLNLPFIQSDSFISVNINSKKDILIACSKIDNKVYLFDTKGNHIDSLPNQERRMNQDRERYVSADFTENDSLIIVVSNIIRNHTAPMEHIMDDYVVYIYNRKWEKIHSFNVHSGRNVIVWNDYLYKYSIGSYSRTLINPSLIKDNL
jgi:WD40 repeat protein